MYNNPKIKKVNALEKNWDNLYGIGEIIFLKWLVSAMVTIVRHNIEAGNGSHTLDHKGLPCRHQVHLTVNY